MRPKTRIPGAHPALVEFFVPPVVPRACLDPNESCDNVVSIPSSKLGPLLDSKAARLVQILTTESWIPLAKKELKGANPASLIWTSPEVNSCVR